jgi:hypothetical protein
MRGLWKQIVLGLTGTIQPFSSISENIESNDEEREKRWRHLANLESTIGAATYQPSASRWVVNHYKYPPHRPFTGHGMK